MVTLKLRTRAVQVVFVCAAVIVGFVASGSASNSSNVRPAAPDEPSYALSGFSIQYPYEDPHTGDVSSSAAGVSFTSSWTTDTYPSEATCLLTVTDAEGNAVGTLEFGLATLRRIATPTLRVPITGEPATASGYCGEAPEAPDAAGYTFTGLAVKGTGGEDDPVRLVGTAHWINGVPAPTQLCTASVLQPTGSRDDVMTFTLDSGDAGSFSIWLPDRAAHATQPQLNCEDFVYPNDGG